MAVSGKNKASSAGALEMAVPAISRKELVERLRAEFPEGSNAGGDYDIEALWRGGCRLRQRYNRRSLRPGGTLSGATMMALGDFGTYVAGLSPVGWGPGAGPPNIALTFLCHAP